MAEFEQIVIPGKRLGKAPPRVDPRTLKAARYIDTTKLPKPPESHQWSPTVKTWPMYDNDKYGDCVWAGQGHHLQLLTAAGGDKEVVLTVEEVLAAYSAVTGFKADDPSTDQGTVMLDAMRYWRSTGTGGHQIAAFVSVDHKHLDLVRNALYLFGGLDVGVALPTSAQGMGAHWTMPANTTGDNQPGSWGGHAIYIVDYDADGVTCVTWGELTKIDWDFWDAYVDEVYAPLSYEFLIDATAKSVQGLDFAVLQTDLTKLGH